ncbi:hypothetical protein M3Y97_00833600 [Aphelenchoides bicaudatus]|nr:hypothetical protein M3Y97_00833600 [Aphelenchoides bicaudatus]
MSAIKRPPDNEDLFVCKVCVIGDGAVGKSSLTVQFFQASVLKGKTFSENYDPTIEDSYIQHLEVDDQWLVLDVLDTAGQEEYSAMREQYMRTGHGFMLVYSVTDMKSFEFVRKLYQQVLRVKDAKEFPVLLVANKIDLTGSRCVNEQQGRELADELKIPYIETSAKNPPINVENAFHELVRIVKSFQADDEVAPNKEAVKGRGGKSSKKGKKHCAVM